MKQYARKQRNSLATHKKKNTKFDFQSGCSRRFILPCWVRSCVWNLASRAISRISRFMCGSMFCSSHTSDGIQRSGRHTAHKLRFARRTDYGNESMHGTILQAQKTKPTKVSFKLWLLKWPRAFAHWNYHCEWCLKPADSIDRKKTIVRSDEQ